MAISSILRIAVLFFAVGFSACGHSEFDSAISVQLMYPASASSASLTAVDAEGVESIEGAENQPGFQYAPALHNTASASYQRDSSNRILIRVLGPGFHPIEAWFERSEGRGVIRGVPPGTRISVEVDEYDSDAAFLGTNARLLGRGWARGITLSAGEDKTVEVAMYAKGTIVTIFGAKAVGGKGTSGDSGDGGLSHDARTRNPSAVKAGPDGSIYVSSSSNGRVKRIDRFGYVSNFAGNGRFDAIDVSNIAGVDASSVSAGFVYDIDIDPFGNIYLLTHLGQIIKVSAAGKILGAMHNDVLINPVGWRWFNFAVVNSNLLYFVSDLDSRVYRIEDYNKSDYVRNGTPYSPTEPFNRLFYPIREPSGITYASKSDSLIFADTGNNRIMELSLSDDRIRYVVADDVGKRSFSEGVSPLSMAPVNPRVVEYNHITGKIFFVEENSKSSSVRYITPDNVVRTFAGTGEIGFSGDGGPAPDAQLYDPRGVTVDSRGNAYIADYGNHAVRKVVGGALP